MRKPAPVVSTYEYGQVILPPRLDTARIRERLESTCLHLGLRVFETRGRRLFARGIVGVIDIGDVIVEILPKTTDGAPASEGVVFLGNLLRFAKHHDPVGLADAGIATGKSGLLEVILAWAAQCVSTQLREGAPRRYAVTEETSTAVRGRVELRHIVRQRPGRSFELTVRHAPLREDNPLSGVIKWLISEVGRRTVNSRTRALCLQLRQSLSNVGDVIPSRADVDAIVLGPMEDRWRPLIALARTFLAQGQPDPARGGRLPAIAVLFTLHDLFEQALRRILAEGLSESLTLRLNSGHLLYPGDGRPGIVRLRPDFRLEARGTTSTRIIGDAKWKRIFDESEQLHLSERDAYQVSTYMAALQADAGFIISPLSENTPASLVRSKFKVSGLERTLDIFGVRIASIISHDSEGKALRLSLCDAITSLLPQAPP